MVALVTEHERQQSYAAFRFGAAVRWRVPVWTSSAVRRIAGRGRLEGVRGGGRADRGGAVRAVRGRGLHRRLDSRPRTGPAGRAGHGSRHPRPGRSTPRSRRRWRACSRPATWCTRPRPRTSPRCPDGTRPGTSRRSSPARAPARAGPGACATRRPILVDAAAAVDLAEHDRRIRRSSPARPVRAPQRRLPSRRQAGGPAGRPAAGQVAPGPARPGTAGAPRRGLAGPGRPGGRPGTRRHRRRSGRDHRHWQSGA